MGSQVLLENLLQCRLLSMDHSSCQKPAPAWIPHRLQASFKAYPPALACTGPYSPNSSFRQHQKMFMQVLSICMAVAVTHVTEPSKQSMSKGIYPSPPFTRREMCALRLSRNTNSLGFPLLNTHKTDLPFTMMNAASELPQFWYSGCLAVRLLNTPSTICESWSYISGPLSKQNNKNQQDTDLQGGGKGGGTNMINNLSNYKCNHILKALHYQNTLLVL